LITKVIKSDFEGVFEMRLYPKKLQEYLDMESRDIWEYHLNLTEEESAQLVRHAWEIRQENFAYQFFAENCSYRMLNFIDVARPGLNLRDQYSVYVIPQDSVGTVIEAD
jgi:hypothetical protein